MECMNVKCGNKSSSLEWAKGWPLRSGGFATLCEHCGSAYKQLTFCETFHSEDSGWRECDSCVKRLHCGCIASSSLLELLDTGGVICNECSKHLTLSSTPSQEKAEACCITRENNTSHNIEKVAYDAGETPNQEHVQPSKIINTSSRKQGDDFAGSRENGHRLLSILDQPSTKSAKSYDLLQESTSILNVHKSLVETDLSIKLPASSNSILIPEEREVVPAILSLERESRSRHHLMPKLPNPIIASGLQTNSNSSSLLRVARPPVEGRVKNQLLPRYWPRITDQELQQISGDSNSTIIPLFEKVLSASDAGRIGRLVLPKACAEAYFPPISQPEGLPLRIQDVKGKEWVFQFRFWPNNNSRMYVLEGVTPCIQSMQLRAGDTVTFSRMDPEGKLMMGFRKASNNMLVQQDSQSAINNGAAYQGELIAAGENLPIMSGYSGLLQTLKGSRNSPMTMLSKQHVCSGIEKETSKSGDNSNLLGQDRKRSRNIGSKGSKRLHIDDYDAMELRLSWEEIQDMLLPPPSVKPSTISIEEYEFEEFDEPPVFAKRSIFIFRQPGEHEQWAQCDSCSKWRKLPIDFLLPSRWTCQDNVNDLTRNSCSAPDELDAQELENLLKMDKEFRNRRFGVSPNSAQEQESQNLEIPRNPTLMSGDSSEPMKAMTTKHPRHRPGCSCIVCIQPPSGKGKHKPTCVCNVCMTVKRRFKTLMMRKKKRQTEREAEIAKNNHFSSSAATKEEAEVDSIPSHLMLQIDHSDHGKSSENEHKSQDNASELLQGGLDLNFCLDRENIAPSRVSMMSLLQEATLPLDTYLRENGLSSLISEQQANSTTVFSKETAENASQAHENDSSAAKEAEELSGKSSN